MNKFRKFPADVICELHPLFKGLLWVASARSTDETRMVLNGVHVEREGLMCHLVATDGKRLHVHTFDPGMFDDDIQMIESGLYEVIIKSPKLIVIAESECGSKYPNWRAIVPWEKPNFSDAINSSTIGKMGIRTGVLLSVEFARDAIGFSVGRKKDDSALVEYGPSGGGTGVFTISHDLGTAYVMPLRFGDIGEDAESTPKDDTEATPPLKGFEPEANATAATGQTDPLDHLKNAMAPGDTMTISAGGETIRHEVKGLKPKKSKAKA